MKYIYLSCFTLVLFLNTVFAATHHPQDFLKSIQGTKDEGTKIVQHYCAVCHAKQPQIELGAPKINDKEAWNFRLQQKIESILEHTKSGFNLMPAMGGCFECSDKQIELAIAAMLDDENQKIFIKELLELKKSSKSK